MEEEGRQAHLPRVTRRPWRHPQQACSPAGRGAAEIVRLHSLHVRSLVLLIGYRLLAVRISATGHGSCERIRCKGSTAGRGPLQRSEREAIPQPWGGSGRGGYSSRRGSHILLPQPCEQPLPQACCTGSSARVPAVPEASCSSLAGAQPVPMPFLPVSKRAGRPGRKGWRGRNSIPPLACAAHAWWLEGAVHSQSQIGRSIGGKKHET